MPTRADRGLTLVEVVIALAAFTLLALTVGSGLRTSMVGSDQAWRLNLAMSAARDRMAQMQETANANLPGFHAAYHGGSATDHPGVTVPIATLPGGTIETRVFINETGATAGGEDGVPAELGGARDLNMDGDAGDDLLPSDAKLFPCVITVRWQDAGNVQSTLVIHHLFTETKEDSP